METIKSLLNFSASLPGKLANLKTTWSQTRDNVTSCYVPAASAGKGLKADASLYTTIRMMEGYGERKCFVGTSKNASLAEILEKDGTAQIAVVTKNSRTNKFEFKAAERDSAGVLTPYGSSGSRKGTLLLLGLMPAILADQEARESESKLKQLVKPAPDADDWDVNNGDLLSKLGKELTVFTSNIYYRMKDVVNAGNAAIETDLKNIGVLRQNDIANTVVLSVLCGTPTVLEKKQVGGKMTTAEELIGKYPIDKTQLTTEEKAMVPKMPASYQVPKWVETEAQMIMMSHMFDIPFRSLLIYGPSGSGKSEGARAIFSSLNLPGLSICCSPNMTTFDFFGQLIPNVKKYGKKSADEVAKGLGIPSFEDVEYDFEGTYKKVFGKEPDEYALPADLYAEIASRMLSSKDGGEPDFIYEETEFVRAYRNGWGIEIQEPTIITKPATLAALNKAFDNNIANASITLPTGEIVKRHPRFVVIMTTNQTYEGCNDIQQSVLSRMQNRREAENPEVAELVKRTQAETKFPDIKALTKMTETVVKINEFCNISDITNGVCGPRELTNWAKRAMLNTLIAEGELSKTIDEYYIVQAMIPTIVEKVSQSKEDQDAVVIEVIQKQYEEALYQECNDRYKEGAA